MSDNKCFTCKHTGAFMTGDTARTCSTCVGFRNYKAMDVLPAPIALAADHKAKGHLADPALPSYNLQKALGFLGIARAVANKSKDRSTKVGTLFLDANFNIRSSGWNGFARGINDKVEARHERPAKYLWACHSEENGVAQAARIGVALDGCTALVTALHPCIACSRMLIQAGIIRVLAPANPDNDRWDEQEAVAMEMLAEAGVEVIRY